MGKAHFKISNKATASVDVEARTIFGIIACEPIDIKDYREWTINPEFITDLVDFATKQKDGIISNFGHNWNNLGKRLGRAINWRIEDGKAKFDLKIFAAADASPGLENLGQYVMELAQEDSKAMMNSIVFNYDYFYQLDGTGKKIKCWYVDSKSNYISANPDLGKIYPKFKALMSTDIVDEGAATNSMFSTSMAEEMLIELDGHPELETLIQSGKFANISKLLSKPTLIEQFKSLFTHKNSTEMTQEDLQKEIADKETELTTLRGELDTLVKQNAANEAEKTSLSGQLSTLQTAINKLGERLETIESFAPDHTKIDDGKGGKDEKGTSFSQNPIMERAKALQNTVK